MSITQTNRPKRSHVFFLKLALGVFVLIFAAMIFLNQMKAKGIADFLANNTGTWKYTAVRLAMPMPDASMVRILSIWRSLNKS